MPYKPRCFIYGLCDPRTQELRYVGQTCMGMKRPTDHSRPWHLAGKTSHTANWIKSLLAAGMMPEIEILEVVPEAELNEAEEFWIAYFRYIGARLTNHMPGGNGARGYRRSDEARAAQSARQKGRAPPPAVQAAAWAANRGSKRSAEFRARISERMRGNVLSLEQRAKISAAMKGRTHSPERIAKAKAARAALDPAVLAAGRARAAEKLRGRKRDPAVVEKVRLANLGKKRSEETRAKMRGPREPYGPQSAEHKAAIARARGARPFQDQTGRVYTTLAEAAAAAGASKPAVCLVLKGKRKAVKGFVFRYVDTIE